MPDLVPAERIENRILLLRGYKVILDSDLAELYEVEVKNLKRQVRRNRDRFPADYFMFELSKEEYESLRRHFGTLLLIGSQDQQNSIATATNPEHEVPFSLDDGP